MEEIKFNPVEFIKTLKVGDSYCYVERSGYSGYKFATKLTVKKFTKTQVVCENNRGTTVRFNIETGRCVGEYGFIPQPASEEEVKQATKETRIRNAASMLSRVTWSRIDGDMVLKISDMLGIKV